MQIYVILHFQTSDIKKSTNPYRQMLTNNLEWLACFELKPGITEASMVGSPVLVQKQTHRIFKL
jgi:hypothetical protein